MSRWRKTTAVIALALVAAGVPLSYVTNAQAAASSLQGGQQLTPGQYIMSTNFNIYGGNGFELILQTDGNMVLYAPIPTGTGLGRYLWASNTYGQSSARATMQTDGNFVIYNTVGQAIWNSGTSGHPNAYLNDQTDGNLVLYSSTGSSLWSTGTSEGTDTASGTANGTCWEPGTPTFCHTGWTGKNTYIYFRAFDGFSQAQPGWLAPAQSAIGAWNIANGPQFYSFNTGNAYVYIYPSNTGQHQLQANNTGITENCYFVPNQPANCCLCFLNGLFEYSNIYLNQGDLPLGQASNLPAGGQNYHLIQNVVAHESGHAMGLGHNPIQSGALMWPYTDGTRLAPSVWDTGNVAFPGCAYGGFGTSCIYGFKD